MALNSVGGVDYYTLFSRVVCAVRLHCVEAFKRGSASVLKVGGRSKTMRKTEEHGEGRFRERHLYYLSKKGA